MLLTAELAKTRGMDSEKLALFTYKYPNGMNLNINSILEANANDIVQTTWLIRRLLTAGERAELATIYIAPLFYYTDIQVAKQCATKIRTWSKKASDVSTETIRSLGYSSRLESNVASINPSDPTEEKANKLTAFAIGTAGYIIGNQLAEDHHTQLYNLMTYSLMARVMFEQVPIGQENKYKEQQLTALISKIENSVLVGL